jgi:Cutinase
VRTTARSGLATLSSRRTLAASVAVASALVVAAGPSPTAQAVTGYHVTAPGGLNTRSGPGVQYSILGRLVDETSLDITCQTTGTLVGTGLGAAPTKVWDKLASGRFVSDFYTSTPATESGWTAGIPRCASSAPVPPPVSSGPKDGCAQVRVLATRASGESSTTGKGSTLGPFATALSAAMPGIDVKVWANPYRAGTTASPAPKPGTARYATALKANIATAATALSAELTAHLAACPAEHLLLVGFGTGAGATHQVWDTLMAGSGADRYRARVEGVVLFADPYLDPAQRTTAPSSLVLGGLDAAHRGILGADALVWSPKLTASYAMRSYCVRHDLLCNFDSTHLGEGLTVHNAYPGNGQARTAGTDVGRRLLARLAVHAGTVVRPYRAR